MRAQVNWYPFLCTYIFQCGPSSARPDILTTEYCKPDTYLSPAGTATTKVVKKKKQTSPSINCILGSISVGLIACSLACTAECEIFINFEEEIRGVYSPTY